MMKKKPTLTTIKQKLRKLESKQYMYDVARCLYRDENFREDVRLLIRDAKEDLAQLWEHREELDYESKEKVTDISIWVAQYQKILRVVDDLKTEETGGLA